MAPAWAPDGRSIAFTSWDDEGQGHVWTVPVRNTGGDPRQITNTQGEYLNTIWGPGGRGVVVTRGSGATSRGRTMASNQYYEFVYITIDSGEPVPIVTVARPYGGGRPLMPRRPIPQASFGPDGRLFYPETTLPEGGEGSVTEIASVRLDGSGRRVHFTLPHADEATVSPDGRWLAFQEGDNVYQMPFPYGGTGGNAAQIDKRNGQLPVTRVSFEGASTRGGGTPTPWSSSADRGTTRTARPPAKQWKSLSTSCCPGIARQGASPFKEPVSSQPKTGR